MNSKISDVLEFCPTVSFQETNCRNYPRKSVYNREQNVSYNNTDSVHANNIAYQKEEVEHNLKDDKPRTQIFYVGIFHLEEQMPKYTKQRSNVKTVPDDEHDFHKV